MSWIRKDDIRLGIQCGKDKELVYLSNTYRRTDKNKVHIKFDSNSKIEIFITELEAYINAYVYGYIAGQFGSWEREELIPLDSLVGNSSTKVYEVKFKNSLKVIYICMYFVKNDRVLHLGNLLKFQKYYDPEFSMDLEVESVCVKEVI